MFEPLSSISHSNDAEGVTKMLMGDSHDPHSSH